MSTCPHPQCKKSKPKNQFACRDHWYSLPKGIRDEIWAGWKDERLGTRWHNGAKAALEYWNNPTMPFGKFEGERLSALALAEPGYLRWVLNNLDINDDLRGQIETALN